MPPRFRGPNKHPGRWSPAKEHERLGFFLIAAMNLSQDEHEAQYVACTYSKLHREYRAHTRWGGREHTAASRESLLIALGRAVEWLQLQRRGEKEADAHG